MTPEDKEKLFLKKGKKSTSNFAMYAIIAVGALYVIVRLVLYFSSAK